MKKNTVDIDVKITEGRSVCVNCGRKKERKYMVKHGRHWTCKICLSGGTSTIRDHVPKLKILNLYAGIGGNRKLWSNVEVTAVELNVLVAAAYQKLYPLDKVVVGNAHDYLLKHFFEFDFIWSSPPCQTHSRMNYWTHHTKKRYPNLSLYEEILFLKAFCKTKFVVENVDPYYKPLVMPSQKIGRHLFWSNFYITQVNVPNIESFMEMNSLSDKARIEQWLGIFCDKNLYMSGKNPIQVYRNCVHPLIGLSVFNDAFCLK